jgi:hypothetical protein
VREDQHVALACEYGQRSSGNATGQEPSHLYRNDGITVAVPEVRRDLHTRHAKSPGSRVVKEVVENHALRASKNQFPLARQTTGSNGGIGDDRSIGVGSSGRPGIE